MTNQKIDLYSIVIPVFNSENSIVELVNRIKSTLNAYGALYEIILIDDCSNDKSWKLITDLAKENIDVKSLQLMKNSGQGNATLAGLEYSSGNFVITIDDDLQHPPEEITKFIDSIKLHSEIDVIIGYPHEKIQSSFRNFGNYINDYLNTLFLGKPKGLRFTGFRLIRKNVVDALLVCNTVYPAIGPMIVNITSKVKNIEFSHEKRAHGRTNYNRRKLFNQFLSNFIGYSVLPLHILAIIGLTGVIISIIAGLFFVFQFFIVGISIPGWTTLLLVLLILMGFTFLSFAILGEYLLRVSQVSTKTSRWNIRQVVKINNSEKTRNRPNNT
jgi:polyisoprenyl-phosphate glycosyltransferase